MAAPVLFGVAARIFSRTLKLPGQSSFVGNENVRHASKKAGGSSRNKRKNTPGKSRGLKVASGNEVHTRQILLTQLGMKYYPGENVGIRHDYSLYALTDGKMMTSSETLMPYPSSPLYPSVQKGRVYVKNFLHVIPDVKVGRFRLVRQV